MKARSAEMQHVLRNEPDTTVTTQHCEADMDGLYLGFFWNRRLVRKYRIDRLRVSLRRRPRIGGYFTAPTDGNTFLFASWGITPLQELLVQ